MELKQIMLENEMELYLRENGFDITDDENCVDSTIIAEYAVDMGYEGYMLDNNEDGKYYQNLIFVK